MKKLTKRLFAMQCFRFAPSLQVESFIGDKVTRHEMSETIKKSRQGLSYCFDVLATTYEVRHKAFNSFIANIDYDHLIFCKTYMSNITLISCWRVCVLFDT